MLASAFSRINSESCAKRTRQDTKERREEREREVGSGEWDESGTDRLRFACPGPFERVELSNDFARGWQLMPLHYPLPVTGYPVTSYSAHSLSLSLSLSVSPPFSCSGTSRPLPVLTK